ncbi:FAD-binding and (Fe-S)-binding domain-containing protein [Diaminobutyricimonas sp. LJ205]|uniref:FAD-binding and (Fe-S)-binding domain-containing protein n=1 Tax=Diaminobutyricimonas sp. LJ205 TaxID=2683590 RepID=UPI0012F4C99E|nr:FAD-binding and (Fe-S)-binding domain-containing protein [Diaminobutyricimonas sp. LJ205]
MTAPQTALPELSERSIDRLAYAHDASHYLLVPDAVATPATADQVSALFRESHRRGVPLTFRSGGTSLSGQGVTDGILVDTRTNFRRIEVLDDGARVRVQPGATVRQVNARLARHGRKLGPDPASEIACTVGGIIANNSSGMACGIEQNSYRTLESLVAVLPSGTTIDSGAGDADEQLRREEPELHAGLAALRARILADPDSVETIGRQFAMKNTMGYGVNAFLDFEAPIDILAHLLVGSEGTLGFVAEATFETVPLMAAAATGLAIFPNLNAAVAALPALVAQGFGTIELMDATSLRVAQSQPGSIPELAGRVITTEAALLIEYLAEGADDLLRQQREGEALLGSLEVVSPVTMTTDAKARAALWHVRKGLYTAVAGARPSGTTALLEDVVVPVERLAATCETLTELFDRHGYEESVIFGHAKDGNIHFMLNERFDDPESMRRYERFTADLVDLILDQGGSLKAEHGTGRIMAPFVQRQYGDELYSVMKEVKRLFDPTNLLNPGVVLSDEPGSYLENLKLVPTVEAEVDRCVECGYCEPACPSRNLTLTPRQRIVIRREMQTAEDAGDQKLLAELRRDYDYEGVQTCAVDGMCQVACPVNINTGDLVRRLRAENVGTLEQKAWSTAAGNWGTVTKLGGVALSVADAFPAALATTATRVGRAVLGADTLPLYDAGLPRGGTVRRPLAAPDAEAVYFPACIGTMFGPEDGGVGVGDAFLQLCERAGVSVAIPEGIDQFCCGTPWKSKGYTAGYNRMTDTVLAALLEASRGGELPIVCDAASCTEGLETMRANAAAAGGDFARLVFVDSIQFVHDRVIESLPVTRPLDSIALHHTCSSTQLGTNAMMTALAERISPDVHVPIDWNCCAFAGDRGLLHPELTASATEAEAAEIGSRKFEAFASANRTCEIGMSRATGQPYQHLLELVEQATRLA